jgi:ubiquinone/menaquinone biosynthesis C-methylase UbiE
MNKLYLNNGEASRLILIFLGWGFPPEAFSRLEKSGYHILLVSGYDDSFSLSEVETFIQAQRATDATPRYEEVVVIGWSFGVKAAELFLAQSKLPITLRLAVNGTEFHIDDERGIPQTIFNGTLEGLTDKSLSKFLLRSCGSKQLYDELFDNQGAEYAARNLETLRSQLRWFATLPPVPATPDRHLWDKAIIGTNDRIFPAQNQEKAWADYDQFVIPNMAHVPDFQWVLDNFVVDKQRVCHKFGSASDTYTDNAKAQQVTAEKLYQHFSVAFANSKLKSGEKFAANGLKITELGYGDGMFTRQYAPLLLRHCAAITLCDIQEHSLSQILNRNGDDVAVADQQKIRTVTADVEAAAFVENYLPANSQDLIFSASMFQWLNSPATMLRRCCKALKQDGMIALSFYGPGTLSEISATVGNGLKYPSADWMQRVARECGLTVELVEVGKEQLTFATANEAVRHLKLTGVNALSKQTSPAMMRRLLSQWPVNEEGSATLTFCPIYMILTKN